MRDSNDQVVSETLKAIALLVPILGATKVVGKNRRKIFADGSPSKVKTKEDIRDNDHITHRLQELRHSCSPSKVNVALLLFGKSRR